MTVKYIHILELLKIIRSDQDERRGVADMLRQPALDSSKV